jgi:hypothetical protein
VRNKQKSDNNGKKLQICSKAAPVLLTNNIGVRSCDSQIKILQISVNQMLNNYDFGCCLICYLFSVCRVFFINFIKLL